MRVAIVVAGLTVVALAACSTGLTEAEVVRIIERQSLSSEQGEAGPQGPVGARGEAGPKGERGPQGAPGVDGKDGEAGPQGPVGARGEAGPKAERGPQGAPGVDGKNGEAGPQGPVGRPLMVVSWDVPANETIIDGTWLVGEDIRPGQYRAVPPEDEFGLGCVWSRLSGLSGNPDATIAFGITDDPVYVEILVGDYAFGSDGCGVWEKTESGGK